MANRECFPVSPYKLTTSIQFNNIAALSTEDTTAITTVTGLSWINAQSIVMLTFAGITTDHEEPDDAMVEGLTAYVGNLVPGVGFDIFASAPLGTWGRYQVTAIIIA
jgi:hypothetical protein